jgi:hypothetical protein
MPKGTHLVKQGRKGHRPGGKAHNLYRSTWGFLFNLQGFSSGCHSLMHEQMGGQTDRMQTPFVRVKMGIFPTWSPSFGGASPSPAPTMRGQNWSPRDSTSRRQPSKAPNFRRSPPPQVSPFPGVSRSAGPLPVIPPSQGPSCRSPGRTTGSRALTGPAAGRSAGQSAAGASSGNAHKTDPHSPRGQPGPPAPEVTCEAWEGGARLGVRMRNAQRVAAGLSPPGGENFVRWNPA